MPSSPPTPGTGGRDLRVVPSLQGSGARTVILDQEHVASVARLRSVYVIGAVLWVILALLDWANARLVDGAPLTTMLVIRVIPLAIMLAAAVRMRRPVSSALLRALDLVPFGCATVAVAVNTLLVRGTGSPFAHGISCILVARGIALPEHRRKGLAGFGFIAALFPLTVLVGAAFDDGTAARIAEPRGFVDFGTQTFLIATTALILAFGNHVVWTLRRQLFEARSVGRYRLKRRIGSGGMGEVWAAWHEAFKRDVAVKVLKPDRSAEIDVVRFEREIQLTSSLTHPNTIRVYDCGITADGLWFYAMELLDGETLAARVRREGALAPEVSVHVVLQACRSLGEAHHRGLVHRDVKPANLVISATAEDPVFVKVLDFGIARPVVAGDDGAITATGAVLGTPAYMSPEQVHGRVTDPRSDVYSLGATLYFALTGRPPFEGTNTATLMLAHAHDVPSPPSSVSQAVSPALDAVVLRCLAKDPADRYADATALEAALAAI